MVDLTSGVRCDIYFLFIFLTDVVRQKFGGNVPGPPVAGWLLLPVDPIGDGPAGSGAHGLSELDMSGWGGRCRHQLLCEGLQ